MASPVQEPMAPEKTRPVAGQMQPTRLAWIFRMRVYSRDRKRTCAIGGPGLVWVVWGSPIKGVWSRLSQ